MARARTATPGRRWTRPLSTLLLLALLAGCSERLDAGQPIALVPRCELSADQVRTLGFAAESWNLELGTQLSVTRAPEEGVQAVGVRQSAFVCAYLDGLALSVGEREVWLCELTAARPVKLLGTAMHEIGHVLNIDEHADDPRAVMSTGSDEVRFFREEDHALFQAANPDFSAPESCGIVRTLGESVSRPVLMAAGGGRTLALWAEKQAVRFVEVDPATGRARGLPGSIPVTGEASWVRAVPSSTGIVVTFVVGAQMYGAKVPLPSGKVGAPLKLEVDSLDFSHSVTEMSIAARGDDLYLSVTEWRGASVDSRLWLYRLDAATGRAARFDVQNLSARSGQLLVVGGDLYLVLADSSALKVERLGPTGAVLDRIDLASYPGVSAHDSLHALASGSTLYVAARFGTAPLRVCRVALGTSMREERRVELAMPDEPGVFDELATALSSTGLIVTVTRQGAIGAEEVHVARLAADTLKPLSTWRRVSAPDLVSSIQPSLVASGSRVVALWRDLHGETAGVKTRCLAW